MKNKIYLLGVFFLFFLGGCFKDEGSYNYTKLDAPEWKFEGAIEMTFRAGETAKFRSTPYFTWGEDSVQRASEVTYEWKLENVVLSNEADFDMPTDELIKRIGLIKFETKAKQGTFSVIEKNTGVTYVKFIYVKITPSNASGDWCIISENGGNTMFSLIKRQYPVTGLTYELKQNIYPELNDGEILGRPLFMAYAEGATNIGAMGAMTVVTTSGEYEINCESMVKVGNLDEIPIQGNIMSRHDAYNKSGDFGLQTFVTDAEGKLYRRMLTKNNLGGEFGTTPLVLDAKGYQITMMGQTQIGYLAMPCYDALHRRMVTIVFYESGKMDDNPWWPQPDGEQYKLSKLCSTQPKVGVSVTGCAPVWDMPVGTKPLHIWYVKEAGNPFMGNYDIIGLIYNDASGKTWLTEFAIDRKEGYAKNDAENKNIEFPGGNLEVGSCFLMSSDRFSKKKNFMLYSKGNQIRYINRSFQFSDNAYITLKDPNDKVTFMAWAVAKDYWQLMVGTEKGKVIFYDAKSGDSLDPNPKLIKEFDLGGRIVSAKELDNESLHGDKY